MNIQHHHLNTAFPTMHCRMTYSTNKLNAFSVFPMLICKGDRSCSCSGNLSRIPLLTAEPKSAIKCCKMGNCSDAVS